MGQQKDGEDESDRGKQVHRLPQLVAGLYIEKSQAEKDRCEEEHREVLHRGARNLGTILRRMAGPHFVHKKDCC